MVIGAMPAQQYEPVRFEVPPGARVYIYSDGAYEIAGPDGKRWGLADFIDLITRLSSHGKDGPKEIITALREVQQSELFDDDLSLMKIGLDWSPLYAKIKQGFWISPLTYGGHYS